MSIHRSYYVSQYKLLKLLFSKVLMDIQIVRTKYDLDRLFELDYKRRKLKVMEFLWDIDYYVQTLPFNIRTSLQIQSEVENLRRRLSRNGS